MRRVVVLACLLAGCAGDKAAPVADAPPPRQLVSFGAAPGAPPANPAPLTRDQLHACVGESQQVHQGSAGAQTVTEDQFKRQDALKARQAELEAQKPAKGSDNATIAAYNKKVRDLNADFSALQRENRASNAKVGGINEAAQKFNADCSGRSFYQDDLDAVKSDFPGAQL